MAIRTFDTHETVPRGVDLTVRARLPDGGHRDGAYNSLAVDDLENEVVEVEVRAKFDDEDLETVLPEFETRSDPPVAIYLVVKSGNRGAFRRQAYRLQNDVTDCFEFDRREWRGLVEIQAVAVRSRSRGVTNDGLAHREGARLGWSDSWSLWLDERPQFAGDTLPIEWVSFQENGLSKDHPAAFFALDFPAGSTPKLLLNKDIDDLVTVLQNNATHGSNARARDAAASLIVHQVWTSLLYEVADHVRDVIRAVPEARGDLSLLSAELPHWAARVLSDWAQPLTGLSSKAEATNEFVRWIFDSPGALSRSVTLAVQQRFSTRKSFEGILRDA